MYYPPVENSLWKQILAQLEKISGEKIVYGLLFLLPIFAVTVRHWVSNIFGVLALLSLVLLYLQRKQRTELLREEKILLWGFAAYFGVFILTSVVNGWGPLQTRYTGVEIRFLLFIPIYLVVRKMPNSVKWLIWGAVFGVVFTAYDAAHEIIVLNIKEYDGVYSPLFTGPVIVLLITILIPFLYTQANNKWHKLLLVLMACLAYFIMSQTGARNAYMAAFILCIMFIFHQYKDAKRYIYLALALLYAYGSYVFDETINYRMTIAYEQYKTYLSYSNPATTKDPLSSIGTRLEMWRATPIFFKDNPVFGVSRGNYTSESKIYAKKGLVHRDISDHGHPHNIYSEAIISKGLIGLLSFLWITLYPLSVLIKDYRGKMKTAFYGVTLITGYLLLSLTDASTFIKGNYVSIYVILLAVLFSFHIQEKLKLQIKSE